MRQQSTHPGPLPSPGTRAQRRSTTPRQAATCFRHRLCQISGHEATASVRVGAALYTKTHHHYRARASLIRDLFRGQPGGSRAAQNVPQSSKEPRRCPCHIKSIQSTRFIKIERVDRPDARAQERPPYRYDLTLATDPLMTDTCRKAPYRVAAPEAAYMPTRSTVSVYAETTTGGQRVAEALESARPTSLCSHGAKRTSACPPCSRPNREHGRDERPGKGFDGQINFMPFR